MRRAGVAFGGVGQPQQPPPQQPPPRPGAAGIGARPPPARPPRATVLEQLDGVRVPVRAARRIAGGGHGAVDLEGGGALAAAEVVARHGGRIPPPAPLPPPTPAVHTRRRPCACRTCARRLGCARACACAAPRGRGDVAAQEQQGPGGDRDRGAARQRAGARGGAVVAGAVDHRRERAARRERARRGVARVQQDQPFADQQAQRAACRARASRRRPSDGPRSATR